MENTNVTCFMTEKTVINHITLFLSLFILESGHQRRNATW